MVNLIWNMMNENKAMIWEKWSHSEFCNLMEIFFIFCKKYNKENDAMLNEERWFF